MITRLTKPKELVEEYDSDRERALYWQKKQMDKEKCGSQSFEKFKSVYYGESGDGRSKIVEYDSPKTGNKWMLWWRFIARIPGKMPEFRSYDVIYRMTTGFMECFAATTIEQDGKEISGVTTYSSHIFQRMTAKDRLGITISDRKLTIRNFIEVAITSYIYIGKPRKGHKHDQCICRMPGSFLFGHVVWVPGSYVMHFNTFIPDKSMTPENWRFVRQFAENADSMSDVEVKEYFKIYDKKS